MEFDMKWAYYKFLEKMFPPQRFDHFNKAEQSHDDQEDLKS